MSGVLVIVFLIMEDPNYSTCLWPDELQERQPLLVENPRSSRQGLETSSAREEAPKTNRGFYRLLQAPQLPSKIPEITTQQ